MHIAVGKDASVEVVKLLIRKYPDAVKEKDENGNLPLHFAVAKNGASDVEVLQVLIKEYPEAVKEKNKYGLLLPQDNS